MKYFLQLNIAKQWKDTIRGKYDIAEFCGLIADELEHISIPVASVKSIILDDLKWIRLSLVDQFNDLKNQKQTTIKELDAIMSRLYCWANYSHLPGIKICEVIM